MKLYINGTLRTTGDTPFDRDFTFVPSDIILLSPQEDLEITLSSEESECSFGSSLEDPRERHFSCRFRGVDAEIISNGRTQTIEECGFMHLAETFIERKLILSHLEAWTDDDIGFEVSVSGLSIFDGNLLADLSEGFDVRKYSEKFNNDL